MEKAITAKQKAVKAWKAGKGTRASYDGAKRIARHAVHHARKEADKKVYENTDPKTSEVYLLANQFRRENADVVVDKPVKNDAGEMSMSRHSKQKAWLEHYQRLLNVEFDWDSHHLSDEPPVEGPPIPITIDMKAISQMKASKGLGTSGIVVKMIQSAGDMGTATIHDLAAAIIHHGKVHSDWEQSYTLSASTRVRGCIEKGKLPRSQADRAGHESPREDRERPHQTVCINRRFPVWLRPRQRPNRCNICIQAA